MTQPRFSVVTAELPRTMRDLGFVAYVRDARHPDGGALSMSWHQSVPDAERVAYAMNLYPNMRVEAGMYMAYTSAKKAHLLEIDQHNSCLQITLSRNSDGETIVGEFDLRDAEEIAADVAAICRDIRHRWGEK